MDGVQSEEKKQISSTTNKIAYSVLAIFSFMLLVVLGKAVYEDNTHDIWFSTFKDGFLLLGGAFTTLIGYYFGSRGGDLAIKEAERKEERVDQIEKQIENMAPNTTETTEGMNQIEL